MLDIYKSFLREIPRDLKKRVLYLIPLLSFSGILEVVSLALLIPLISLVLNASDNIELIKYYGLDSYSKNEKLLIVFCVFIMIIIFKGFFVFFVSRFTFSTALNVKVFLQNKLFSQYLRKDFVSHLDSNSANYLRNITTECHQIEGRFIMPGLTLMAEILPVLFVFFFLLYLNPLGVIVSIIVFTLSGLVITKITSKYLKKYGEEQIKSDGMQVKVAKEAFSLLKEIALYKKDKEISDSYNTFTLKSARLISNALALGQIPKFVLEVVGLLTIALIAFISFTKGSTANEVLIQLAVFMGAIVKLLPSMNRIVMNFQSLAHAKPAIENIILELNNVRKEIGCEDVKSVSAFKSLVFEKLCFRYPNSKDLILENADLYINRGDIIGIKGESGSGKSTLINLVLGLFNATEGRILINGTDINICKRSWQDKISYVSQDVILFDDTLKNNITFYQNEISVDEINVILKKIKLSSFIGHLDKTLGEGGSSLSGGQKQRVGIARALIRKPEFVIFDEATSALDNETELEINKLIKEISQTVTVFVIAHKSTALDVCDRVYTIKNKSLIQWKK
ncbi:ATP-binding cassette domain-containing protein [Marinomonas sp.]|uniref:ATP-binding cassette domain-containing protein n=1 Tax=Marinomonas sp. TaxID=1904862 RepID=UPI003BA8C913